MFYPPTALRRYALVAALAPLAFAACDDNENQDDPLDVDTVKEVVGQRDELSELDQLVDRADLGALLDDDDQTYTVFAPTNDAFAGVATDSLSDDALADVLRYHVIGGTELTVDEIGEGYTVATTATGTRSVSGDEVSLVIYKDGSTVSVNGIGVTAADIDAGNGVIHEIGAVLMPPSVAGFATALPGFSTLRTALTSANGDLPATLDGTTEYTVFAPTDAAFAAAAGGLPSDQDGLAAVLSYHVIAGNVRADDLAEGANRVATVNGDSLTVTRTGDAVSVTDARGDTYNVVLPNVQATNGVVHAIDGVLLPEAP